MENQKYMHTQSANLELPVQAAGINDQLLNVLNLTLETLQDVKKELQDLKNEKENKPPQNSDILPTPEQFLPSSQYSGVNVAPMLPLLPRPTPSQRQESEVLQSMRMMMMGMQHMAFMNSLFYR